MLLTDLPMYLYHSYELPCRGDGALFHFTSWEKFELIMSDLSLLPSTFGNLNDLNEEIDSMSVSQEQKDEMKRHWKLCLESYVQGVKDELRKGGRLVL